jgi:hypothetical protein
VHKGNPALGLMSGMGFNVEGETETHQVMRGRRL